MEGSEHKSIDVNISNKAIDAVVDGLKGFLQSLIKPSLDEVGLLLADQFKAFRFKNQLNLLAKTQEYLKNKNIDPNKISLKVLFPLLEYSSLEEDESLQDKWAALLANTAMNAKLNTSLFSYILSQLNPLEARILDEFYTLSRQLTNEPNITVFIKGYVRLTAKELNEKYGYISVEIDNLIRLNLIGPVDSKYSLPIDFTITDLGYNFCRYVKFGN